MAIKVVGGKEEGLREEPKALQIEGARLLRGAEGARFTGEFRSSLSMFLFL